MMGEDANVNLPVWMKNDLEEYVLRKCDRVLGVKPGDLHSFERTCKPTVDCVGYCWKARMKK